MKKTIWKLGAIAIAMTIASCGGGSSSSPAAPSTDVTGLEIANQMSIVTSSESSSNIAVPNTAKGLKGLLFKALTSDTSTAYYTTPLNVWAYDDSMEALNTVNEILCSIDQTKYADMVNEGDYIALIDNAKCDKSSSKSSDSSNQSSGSNAEELEVWTVNSSRATSTSSQIVKAWVNQTGDDFMPAMTIYAKMEITEAVSTANPYGVFHIDFKMTSTDGATTYGQGYLESLSRDDGQLEFQVGMNMTKGTEFTENTSTHALLSADKTAGNAYAYRHFSFSGAMGAEEETKTIDVAFNTSYYHAKDRETATEACLDKVNLEDRVFRYGLFNADGSAKNVANPGFGIKYTSGDDVFYGWAGYWGIWMPEDVTLVSGMTVEKAQGSESGTAYTTFVAPGKLVKHEKILLTLADIEEDYLSYSDQSEQGGGTTYRVQWNGSAFMKVATQSYSGSSMSWVDIAPVALTVTPNQWLNFWRDGMGSLNVVVPESGELASGTEVISDSQQVLTAEASDFAGGELTLVCYQQCLRPNLDGAMWDDMSTAYFPNDGNTYTYTIDPADMTLMSGGQPVKTGADVSAGGFMWGAQTGAMVTQAIEDSTIMGDSWKIWNQDVSYTWETGPNNWNQLTALKDAAGDMMVFDPPMQVIYTHVASGTKYFLDYSGFGELQGLPWVEDADQGGRWYPEITIPDASEVMDSDGVVYYTRALEKEQLMPAVANSACSAIAITALDAPDVSFVDPDIGVQPTVDDTAKVIKGEVQ